MTEPSTIQPASRIAGTGHYVPEKVLTNFDLEKMVDTSDEWIVGRTGIHERRVAAEGESSSDMAAEAARRALAKAELEATDIDLILVATVTPDMPLPATAMFVQQKIGARASCPGFDLAAACAGFIYGLSIADQYVRSGAAKHVLVIGVELLSRVLDWTDRSTCVLFGDGAGAVVVSGARGDDRGIVSTHIYGDGRLAESLCIPGGGSREPTSHESVDKKRHLVHMLGQDIFKVAVKNLTASSITAIEHSGLVADDIDWVVPHQANARILKAAAKRSGVSFDRFFLNVENVGNTSSASIPLALLDVEPELTSGDRLILCSVGAGVTTGAVSVEW